MAKVEEMVNEYTSIGMGADDDVQGDIEGRVKIMDPTLIHERERKPDNEKVKEEDEPSWIERITPESTGGVITDAVQYMKKKLS